MGWVEVKFYRVGIVNDELDMQFRIEAVKSRRRLNKAFEEAMKL